MRAGEVTDFVQIPLGFPAFNVADMSITFGVITLLVVIERQRCVVHATAEDAGERLDVFLAGAARIARARPSG